MSGWNKNHFHFHFPALLHPSLTSRFSSVPSLDVASSSQPTVTSMLRRFLPWTIFLWIMWNSWFCQTAVFQKSAFIIHMIHQKKTWSDIEKKTWTRTGDVSPANCLDSAFLVSSLTELLQHEELLQQVWQKFQLRKELCLSDLGFFYTDQSDQYYLRFNLHLIWAFI